MQGSHPADTYFLKRAAEDLLAQDRLGRDEYVRIVVINDDRGEIALVQLLDDEAGATDGLFERNTTH